MAEGVLHGAEIIILLFFSGLVNEVSVALNLPPALRGPPFLPAPASVTLEPILTRYEFMVFRGS